MDKSNLELFKQAISEGLSDRFDNIVDNCTEAIVCSEKHKLAMRTIVYGKVGTGRTMSPKMRKIIAILVAAALLLTSCAVIFRNEIREIFEEFFVKISCSNSEDGQVIEEVYQLGYLPEGYSLSAENIRPIRAQYKFTNENGDYIWFEQKCIDGTDFYVDNEEEYSRIEEIRSLEVYYRYTNKKHVYIWNDGKYSFKLSSTTAISNDETILLLEGLTTK